MGKRLIANVRRHLVAYAGLLVLFSTVIAFQLRMSIDTVQVERSYEFHIPFLLEPFSNRIAEVGSGLSWEAGTEAFASGRRSALHVGDHVLSVNGRPFKGASMYLRELWRTQHQPAPSPPKFEWRPFKLQVYARDGSAREIEMSSPHCTCGVPGLFEATAMWVLPPLFCVLLGFVIAFMRPRALLAWAFLLLMLSLSQLQVWPDAYSGFQLTTTPMLWDGPFRVFGVAYQSFVQHCWPAALCLALAQLCGQRRRLFRLTVAASCIFLVAAIVQSALAVSWSEDYHHLVALEQFLRAHGTEARVISFLIAATLSWSLNRKLGAAVMVVGLFAAWALYVPARPITHGYWQHYSDDSFRFDPSLPGFHNTPEAVTLLFVTSALTLTLTLFRRLATPLALVSFLLCLPLICDLVGRFGRYLYPLGAGLLPGWPYYLWSILVSSGLGLIGTSICVVRWIRAESPA